MIQDSESNSPVRNIRWTLIDRWPLNEGLVESISDSIQVEMAKLPADSSKAVILFSAHSLPLKVRRKLKSLILRLFFPFSPCKLTLSIVCERLIQCRSLKVNRMKDEGWRNLSCGGHLHHEHLLASNRFFPASS